MKQVSMIASGYEWNCPTCDTLNKEIAIPKAEEYPTCSKCGETVDIINVDHCQFT